VRGLPLKTYSGKETIDILTKKGFSDMVKALRWIAETPESRDFATYGPHVQRLPESLTNPNMGGVVMDDEHALYEFSFMSNLF
jgi:PhoPQ-activated pathogenicity-related protein